MLKKIMGLLLTTVMLVGLVAALGACDNGEEGKPEGTTYTVTLTDGTSPIAGAKITFISATGTKKLVTTDAEGKATYTATEGTWQAQVFQASGYEFDKNTKYDFTDGKATITLAKEASNEKQITVFVKDASGAPVAGVEVQVCDTVGVCKTPISTDAEGKAVFTVDADKTWKATFYPSGDNSEYVYFENDVATLIRQ